MITKSSGPDGIYPRGLKGICNSIKKPLTKLYNISFESKKLPDFWKLAQITPVFKNKGSAQEVSNYIPISLKSKIMEKYYSNTYTISLLIMA
jgi:hypothetical protein